MIVNIVSIGLFSFVEWRLPDLRFWLWGNTDRLILLIGEFLAAVFSIFGLDFYYDTHNDKDK